ncbi:MAG: glycoside hydrolase family 57 protein [Pseudomonadota bacterium]
MKNTSIAFLWHMHQPYYRDMVTGESSMPWVRLHGTHSYFDMLRLYRKFPNVKGTINFVPSLIEQLLAYTEEGKSDAFLDHTLVPATELTIQQKVFLLRHFFMANTERKIEPYGPYQKLRARLGQGGANIDYNQAVRFFSTQEYLNLQVYYNLIWFGFASREEIPELTEMLSYGGHFTEDQKLFVVDTQRKVLGNLLKEISAACESENVEICTTPFFHPMLPLLIDTDIAKRANPKTKLPPRFRAPEIARAQVKRALDAMERWTGRRPKGMWPAEGGVSPEIIPLLHDAGVKWIASDERVLELSLTEKLKATNRYQPFRVLYENAGVDIVFRDHILSDLISFTYCKMPAEKAAEDFISRIRHIDKAAKDKPCLITIVLDGENPWEFYPDAGKEFLNALFTAIEREGISTTRIGDYVETHPPQEEVLHLHSGSWIDANFNIWIGKTQKNQAWDYIKRTLGETEGVFTNTAVESEPNVHKAFESLCAACGSDWFWWYDDDFDSAFKGDFDRIFRTHLKNTFSLLGKDVPLFLFEPIYRFEEEDSLIEPPGFIYPAIDGTQSSFFEWGNASHISVHGRTSGAMAQASSDPFETISFGFNERSFFLRVDPVDRSGGFLIGADDLLNIAVHNNGNRAKFCLSMKEGRLMLEAVTDKGGKSEPHGVRFGVGEVLELDFEFQSLGLKVGDEVTLTISLCRHGIEVRRFSHIHFIVPNDNYELRMWYV